jgi:hypothetical protein
MKSNVKSNYTAKVDEIKSILKKLLEETECREGHLAFEGLLKIFETGVNKTAGQAHAVKAELYYASKHRVVKGRRVTLQDKSDVNVGDDSEPYGKVVEIKSTVAKGGAVTTQLTKALEQLSRKSFALNQQISTRKVILFINNSKNRWPLAAVRIVDGKSKQSKVTIEKFNEVLEKKFDALIKSFLENTTDFESLKDWLKKDSTSILTHSAGNSRVLLNKTTKIRQINIKIEHSTAIKVGTDKFFKKFGCVIYADQMNIKFKTYVGE